MFLPKPLILAAILASIALPSLAGEGFRPGDSCNDILTGASPTTRIMVATWVIGYIDSGVGDEREVNVAEVEKVLNALGGICAANPQQSLLNVADAVVQVQMQRDEQDAPAADAQADGGAAAPGSEAAARQMLAGFLAPNADLAELTWAMVASPEDIRAVYKEPLASRMIQTYGEKLTRGIKIGPKPGQSELLTWWSTTDDLVRGSEILDYFPGGYARVLDYMNPGFPVVRFKFVEPGADIGMAFDGLFWVNDHWAWMPKPWRMLE